MFATVGSDFDISNAVYSYGCKLYKKHKDQGRNKTLEHFYEKRLFYSPSGLPWTENTKPKSNKKQFGRNLDKKRKCEENKPVPLAGFEP